jgi:hypothetical protein
MTTCSQCSLDFSRAAEQQLADHYGADPVYHAGAPVEPRPGGTRPHPVWGGGVVMYCTPATAIYILMDQCLLVAQMAS